MSAETLRILFVEDSVQDVELEEHELRNGGLTFASRRVETRDQLTAALDDFKPHLVLSDFSLPQLDGLSALRIVREKPSDVPFIFVSGTIGEERAIESLKNGATDYVVKDRLKSLVAKIRRALDEAGEREKRRRVEEQLRQAHKMEAVGRLAGGITHDFNNLLTVIMGYSELLMQQLPAEHELRSFAEEIQKSGERAAALTRQLLAFSRKQVLAPVVLDLNTVLSGVEKMLRRLIGADIEIRTAPGAGLGRVKADPGQVEQVILNLCVNARDAMPRGGVLTVSTGNASFDADDARPFVMLSVSDTGIGMDEETLSHLFEPFFTTKEQGKGTGLGLSTVYGIVRQSGGEIRVSSVPGSGSTFRVFLPRVEEETSSVPPKPASSSRGDETILLVEDSESVRRIMTAVLEGQGYRVLGAGDGLTALRLLSEAPGPVPLLIADVVLPRMSGPEVAYRAARAKPGIRILFTSGDTAREILEEGILQSGVAFLAKPFLPDALVKAVRDILGVQA